MEENKHFCTNCGKEIEKNWDYCKHCGATISIESNDSSIQKNNKIDNSKKKYKRKHKFISHKRNNRIRLFFRKQYKYSMS